MIEYSELLQSAISSLEEMADSKTYIDDSMENCIRLLKRLKYRMDEQNTKGLRLILKNGQHGTKDNSRKKGHR